MNSDWVCSRCNWGGFFILFLEGYCLKVGRTWIGDGVDACRHRVVVAVLYRISGFHGGGSLKSIKSTFYAVCGRVLDLSEAWS